MPKTVTIDGVVYELIPQYQTSGVMLHNYHKELIGYLIKPLEGNNGKIN